MANVNRPRGLNPVQNNDGTTWSQGATLFCIPASDTTNAYTIGDVVQAAAGSDADGIQNCAKWFGSGAAAGTTPTTVSAVGATTLPIGVVVGIRVADPGVSLQGTSLSLEKAYISANTGVAHYVYVVTDPGTIFEIQADSSVVATSMMNGNCGLSVTQTPAGLSTAAPYSTTVATGFAATNTLPLQVIGLAQRPDNVFGAYASVYVRFNVHNFYGQTSGRTGV